MNWPELPVVIPGREIYTAEDDKFQFVIVYEPRMGARPWSWLYKRKPSLSAVRMGDCVNFVEAKKQIEDFRTRHS